MIYVAFPSNRKLYDPKEIGATMAAYSQWLNEHIGNMPGDWYWHIGDLCAAGVHMNCTKEDELAFRLRFKL